MSLKTTIHDVRNNNSLKISEDGELYAYTIPAPPTNTKQLALPFSQYLSTNGESDGTTNMLVNGATTNVDFYIAAKEYDIYINTLSVLIADASSVLNSFGNIAALTNGLEFYYFNQEVGKYTIEDSIKTNFEFLRLAGFEPAYGTGTAAFQGTNVIGTSEAYTPVIDLEDIFGLPWGLKLRANTTDRVGFIVKDNISTLDAVNIKGYGVRILN